MRPATGCSTGSDAVGHVLLGSRRLGGFVPAGMGRDHRVGSDCVAVESDALGRGAGQCDRSVVDAVLGRS